MGHFGLKMSAFLGVVFFVSLLIQSTIGTPVRVYDYEDTVEVGAGPVSSGVRDSDDPSKICSMPPKRGHCRALLLRWRFDPSIRDCTEFKFGGCDGNANNFNTKKLCMKMCQGI